MEELGLATLLPTSSEMAIFGGVVVSLESSPGLHIGSVSWQNIAILLPLAIEATFAGWLLCGACYGAIRVLGTLLALRRRNRPITAQSGRMVSIASLTEESRFLIWLHKDVGVELGQHYVRRRERVVRSAGAAVGVVCEATVSFSSTFPF